MLRKLLCWLGFHEWYHGRTVNYCLHCDEIEEFESQREELERSESEMAAAEALKLIEEALISLS